MALTEYILFEDAKTEARYALLKFINNLDQSLYGVQFEVLQYDADKNLLEKSLVVYDKFNAEAHQSFVPKAKLKLSPDCRSISVHLVSAEFDRIRWEKGEFTDNPYTFERAVRARRCARTEIGAADADRCAASDRAEAVYRPRHHAQELRRVSGRVPCACRHFGARVCDGIGVVVSVRLIKKRFAAARSGHGDRRRCGTGSARQTRFDRLRKGVATVNNVRDGNNKNI